MFGHHEQEKTLSLLGVANDDVVNFSHIKTLPFGHNGKKTSFCFFSGVCFSKTFVNIVALCSYLVVKIYKKIVTKMMLI